MRRPIMCAVVVLVVVVEGYTKAPASTIEIQFSGLDMVYDGSNIYDAGGYNQGDVDPLTTVTYLVDGSLSGTQVANIDVDFRFGPIIGVPTTGGTVNTGSDPSGFFDLLVPGIGLTLDLGDVSVTYLPLGFADLVFVGSLAAVSGQSLPYGLIIGDDVSVSFSAQINTISDDGTYITDFTASGTGEVSGPQVPEPSTLALLCMGALGLLACARRRRKR